jgi:N-acetylneuraminate synthase/N,N'-diacetyllegionaminate synthase
MHYADTNPMDSFAIDSRPITPTARTFVIAEIGVNHDGSIRKARELVELAAACGADAVKLQIFTADKLMHASSQFAEYQQTRVNDTDPAAMLRRYELSPADITDLVAMIRRKGLVPIATPFSPADVAVISELNLPAVKVASPDLVNRPLLSAISSLNVPMILSTGAATMDEVHATHDWLGDRPHALLHCISSYPTPAHHANLCWISELASAFDVPVGFSDHGTDDISGALAVASGACIIEKHFTYDRSAVGPDHSASAGPEQFSQYVKLIRRAELLRGTAGKRVLEIEQDVRKVSRQSLVICRDVPAGHVLDETDLTVQRPGVGIPAGDVELAIGRAVSRALPGGTMLSWDMLAA